MKETGVTAGGGPGLNIQKAKSGEKCFMLAHATPLEALPPHGQIANIKPVGHPLVA